MLKNNKQINKIGAVLPAPILFYLSHYFPAGTNISLSLDRE